MRPSLPWLLLAALAGCGETPVESPAVIERGNVVPMAHAKTFTVVEREGHRVVDLSAPIITWGGAAVGPVQHARVVLVPRTAEPPPLVGDLAGATVIRTPVNRIAVNLAPFEAMLRELGIADRLVAVGGVKSWDDDIRRRARDGELAQIGYGWHMPPLVDTLLAARADVFLMSLGDLSHAQHYERLLELGVPVVPAFLDAEPHYLGKVDYVRLIGMLTGRERDADAFVEMVTARVAELKRRAAEQPPVTAISAWYEGGDVWMATVRNADNAFLVDANGVNPLGQLDDNRLDSFQRISTEQLLERGRDAACWIARDTHSARYPDVEVLEQFRAWREDCVFASDGMAKPEADAFDYYETAVIRPDWLLADIVGMLHPELASEPFRYVRPDVRVLP